MFTGTLFGALYQSVHEDRNLKGKVVPKGRYSQRELVNPRQPVCTASVVNTGLEKEKRKRKKVIHRPPMTSTTNSLTVLRTVGIY